MGTKVAATVLCADGFGLSPPIRRKGIALDYSIVWSFFTDWAEVAVYCHHSLTAVPSQIH